MAEQKNIESKVLLSVSRKESQDGKRATEIRVIEWKVDDKVYPLLEKREMYTDGAGVLKMGKCKGFNLADLVLVQDSWDDIVAALG